ncbi:MAG: CaiB/BaiF CoA-transferase family protein [Actinomycetota bacterium]|nr:CaiB/BaiF CoA-transferase family protein [Actinomycetota bacterium]
MVVTYVIFGDVTLTLRNELMGLRESSGPLSNILVVEFPAIGPAPFAGMLLADMGATVIRIDRRQVDRSKEDSVLAQIFKSDVMGRSKVSIDLDFKDPEDFEIALSLIRASDVLLEGFRPGVMERLGFTRDRLEATNPHLTYGRMTGWGQSGPISNLAGHDMNYISLSGVLSMIGEKDGPPSIPLNLIGDFGGGGMAMAFAIVSTLVGAREDRGFSELDVAMIDGASNLAAMIFGMRSNGSWLDQRGSNLLDGGTPFYSIYRCGDGGYFGVAALEPQFYRALVATLGVDSEECFVDQSNKSRWNEMRRRFEEIFASNTRQYFTALLSQLDTCAFPVLTPNEAIDHPHNRARGSFVEVAGVVQPAPFAIVNGQRSSKVLPPPFPGRDSEKILAILKEAAMKS